MTATPEEVVANALHDRWHSSKVCTSPDPTDPHSWPKECGIDFIGEARMVVAVLRKAGWLRHNLRA